MPLCVVSYVVTILAVSLKSLFSALGPWSTLAPDPLLQVEGPPLSSLIPSEKPSQTSKSTPPCSTPLMCFLFLHDVTFFKAT